MKASLQSILDKNRIMVIDGSMSAALEELGADLKSSLWTARVLAQAPELIARVHKDYFKAGADCGISCSYQASIPGFVKYGHTENEAEKLIASSVEILKKARDEWWREEGEAAGRAYPLCLASVGPYGAFLADGSEYTGRYDLSPRGLYDFHEQRMGILKDAGADVLLIETQPSLREALIEAEIAEGLGADYWISFSCADGSSTCAGDLVSECAKALSKGHPGLIMTGVNCTGPEFVEKLIKNMRRGTDLPIGVYPNDGKRYDPVEKRWSRGGEVDFGAYALRYMKAGASAVGGCCTTGAEHIKAVAAARERFLRMGRPAEISL